MAKKPTPKRKPKPKLDTLSDRIEYTKESTRERYRTNNPVPKVPKNGKAPGGGLADGTKTKKKQGKGFWGWVVENF
jgi:hypothetical protein